MPAVMAEGGTAGHRKAKTQRNIKFIPIITSTWTIANTR